MMKKNPLFLMAVLYTTTIYGQDNPYKSLGIDVKVVTLSKGKYKEFFDDERIIQIGSIIYDIEDMKMIGIIKNDSLPENFYLLPLSDSRWISPDPLADEFESVSPYNFGMNNPIRFTDPTGLAAEDIILGGNSKQQKRTFAQLQSLSNDRLGFVPSTGEVFVKKSNAVNSTKRLTQSSALIKELINSDKVVTIKISGINATNPVDENRK